MYFILILVIAFKVQRSLLCSSSPGGLADLWTAFKPCWGGTFISALSFSWRSRHLQSHLQDCKQPSGNNTFTSVVADTLFHFLNKVISLCLQVYVEPIDHSACWPDCKMSLRLLEDRRGYNITLRADRNDATVEARTFHFGVPLWNETQQSWWSRNTYFPINQWSLMLTTLILCVILASLQFQSPWPIFVCTARWLLPSFRGSFTDIKVYPLWCYTTLAHKLSQITASTHQKLSLNTKWKVSSLALASEPKLWWQRY